MQKLLVYRSSAGSGKTYTLVKTYLSLLFKIKSNFGFKQILAITFTNKAAEEMKKRVLTALDEISSEGKKNKLAIEISKENNFEYNGTSLNSLFSQRRNLLSPKFLKMIFEILRFNKESIKLK